MFETPFAIGTRAFHQEFMSRLDGYLHWYNERRIKMSLGGKSPLEYRQALGCA